MFLLILGHSVDHIRVVGDGLSTNMFRFGPLVYVQWDGFEVCGDVRESEQHRRVIMSSSCSVNE